MFVAWAAWTSKQTNRHYILYHSRHPGWYLYFSGYPGQYFPGCANWKTQKFTTGCKFAFLIPLISPLLKCAHCPGCGFLGIWWNVTPANRVHFTGWHWRGKAQRGLVCGRFFEVAVIHFEFRWLATAPLAAPVRSQATRVSTHPVSASGILLFAQATNRLTHDSFGITGIPSVVKL